MASLVGNIAPFINDEFTVVSEWWKERVNPVTGETEIHRGLDISTHYQTKPVYSMLDGKIHSKGSNSTSGNWVIIVDDNMASPTYGYATRYLHLLAQVTLPVGAQVFKNGYIGMEGSTGQSTGVHLHVEMQDISRFNWEWHFSYTKSDYLDPTQFMGINNTYGSEWIYDGTPHPIPQVRKRKHFNWALFSPRIIERILN